MKKLILFTCLIVLSACGVSKTDGVMERSKNSGGFMGLSQKDAVEIKGDEALQGVDTIVIGSFKVGFVESSVSSRKAGGGLMGGASGFGGKAKGNVRLAGVSDSTKQEITEIAYTDFVNTLKAQGYNIADRKDFIVSEEYGSLKKYSFPYVADDSGFLSSYGKTVFFQPVSMGNEGIVMSNDIKGLSGGFAFGNSDAGAINYAKATGIPVVSATYIVDFVANGGHGGKWSSTASVKVGQNLAVTSGTFKILKDQSSSFNEGVANVSLGQPIEAGQEFATIVEETSAAEKVMGETLNVASVLIGGGSSRTRDYAVVANPDQYAGYAISILKQANTELISTAAQGR
jgi:hypothetical protein